MDFRPMSDGEIERWYADELCTAFAPQECKPLADIFHLIEAGRYEIWGMFESGGLVGYAAIWKAPRLPLVLLDYLGVTALQRNQGLGACILGKLKEQGRAMVVEAELPVNGDAAQDNSLRRRRIAFYQRNGFTKGYVMATCGMAWQALLVGTEHLPMKDVMQWHRDLYGPARTDVIIPLTDTVEPPAPYWMAT
jgi:GNAT superfamily N-acetyltransferase